MPEPSERSLSHAPNLLPLRALVADDDPGSCRFLSDGLRSLGVSVTACADGTQALERARNERFDLLLLDCRMPGYGARQILAVLRQEPQSACADSFAVATSAEFEAHDRQSLFAAGIGEILLKPCVLDDLRRILALVHPDHHGASLLDDGAAITAAGDAATMRALRQLLRAELIQLEQELDQLGADRASFGDRLHRLRSSCGFCGAAALSTQVILLQRQLAQDETLPVSLTHFRRALRATLRALDD